MYKIPKQINTTFTYLPTVVREFIKNNAHKLLVVESCELNNEVYIQHSIPIGESDYTLEIPLGYLSFDDKEETKLKALKLLETIELKSSTPIYLELKGEK